LVAVASDIAVPAGRAVGEKFEFLWAAIKTIAQIAAAFAIIAAVAVGCEKGMDALPNRSCGGGYLKCIGILIRWIVYFGGLAVFGAGICWVWVQIHKAIYGENAMSDNLFVPLAVIHVVGLPILFITADYLDWI